MKQNAWTNINPEVEIPYIVDEIKDYFVKNGNKNTKAIIGISGGKDSTVAAALLVRALGPERVLGVLMPCGKQTDISDSYRVVETLGIPHIEVNIGQTMGYLTEAIPNDLFGQNNPAYFTNTPARLRMTTLYGVAALVGGRVINTGNASELYVGYTTKYGDLAGDFAILKNYYVRDVIAIGDALDEIPSELIHKTPGDGMSGKTDEDNMGFTYEVLDTYLIDGIAPDYDTLRNIEERHKRNIHKNDIRIPSITALSRKWVDNEGPFTF